jgi:DNA topoisomerase VI, subunit B
MIPTKVDRDIIRGGDFQEQKMGIAAGQEAWIFNILRNKTYTNKILAPIREYTANALDEHEKAGISHIPVKLTFPNVLAPEFRVRDFALGLSDDDVVKFFANYGASDKRDSNLSMGAFGIGAKAAFAYTDSFTVVSYQNGRKATFNLYIDETEVGAIAQLAVETTDEPNGIEIVIPVRSEDISKFVSNGFDLMKYVRTKPTIEGVSNVPDFDREASPVSGKNWKYFGDNRGSVVIQGQIGYPLALNQMGSVSYASEGVKLPAGQIYEWEKNLLASGLEIDLPIGTVDVAASREGLEMNAKTIAAIRSELVRIRKEITDHVSDKFKAAKNLLEAKIMYYNFFLKGGSYGNTLARSVGKVWWNGIEITDATIDFKGRHKIIRYKRKANGDIMLDALEKIQCSDELELYYDDTDRKIVNYKRRANTLFAAGAKYVTVIQTDDVKAFESETGLKVADLKPYSKVVPTVVVSSRAAGSGIDATKRVKHKLKVFELDWKKLQESSYLRGAKSDFWKVAEIEIDKQVFVPIDRFEPAKGMFGHSLSTMREYLMDLHLFGIDVAATPIYGIKAGQETGDMVRVDAWAIEKAKALPKLADEVAVIKDWQTCGLFEFVVDIKSLPKGSLAAEYRKQYQAAAVLMQGCSNYTTSASVRARINLADLIKLELPNVGKLLALSNEFRKTYPLLEFLDSSQQTSNQPDIVNYITLVDEARELAASAMQMAAAA